MIIFLISHPIIVTTCDPSAEPSRRDSSDEGSQHTFLFIINKNYPNYHQSRALLHSLLRPISPSI